MRIVTSCRRSLDTGAIRAVVMAALGMLLFPACDWAQGNACDLNQDGAVGIADVNAIRDMVLGVRACTANITGAGVCNVVTIQRVVNALLGQPCVTDTPVPGLVAAYAFNEGIGTTVVDASGNGNTGTMIGASWTPAGKFGNALSFNGSTSYVDLGNPASLQLTGSMTIEAWINAAANPLDDGQIVAKSDDAGGWQLKTSPDTGPHTFGVAASGSASAKAQRYSSTVRSLGTWYHVAGVYDMAARTLST